jgi:hypothetical protein
MLVRKWPLTLGLVTLTAVVSAVSTLALQSTRAVAQTNADCKILWDLDDNYGQLANQASAFVAKGYVATGLAAQDSYLYILVCRK